MARGVHVGYPAVHHLRAGAHQSVDHPVHVALVAGDRMAGQDDRVVVADLQPLALPAGQQRQGGHRLALGAGGDDAHSLRRELLDLLDVDEHGCGHAEELQVHREAHVLLHAPAHQRDLAVVLLGGLDDLLHAVDVAGEAGGDDAAVAVLVEEVAQHAPDAPLAGGVAGLLGVRGVAHEQADADGARELAETGEVRAPVVDGGEVQLEVARVHHNALVGVHDDGVRMRHGVRDGQELHVEPADVDPLAVAHLDQLGALQQAGLLDAVAREPEGDRGAVHGELDVAQQELQSADVVLVAVRGHAADDPVRVLAQEGEVGQHEVDAVHVGVGEHEPAVDHQQAVVLLEHHAVAADLAEAAEEIDAYGGCHAGAQRRAARAFSRFACTFAARSASPAGGGPMGRRHSPTSNPRWFIITLLGIGLGLSSPVSKA